MSISYQKMSELSKKFACYLLSQGIGEGCRVFCRAEQSVVYPVIYAAVLRTKAVFVPIGKNVPSTRFDELVQELSASLTIGSQEDKREGIPFIAYEEVFAIAESQALTDLPELFAEDDAYVVFTSGSTGKSKGALNARRRTYECLPVAHTVNYPQGVVNYLFAPVDHTAFFGMFSGAIGVGGETIIAQNMMDVGDFIYALQDRHANALHATPTVVNFWMTRCGDLLEQYSHQIKTVTLAGEKASLSVQNDIVKKFPYAQAYNMYGSTEAGLVSGHCFTSDGIHEGCVGQCLEGVSVSIEDGRIIICTPFAMKGYIGYEPCGGRLETDDAGYVEDGRVFVAGRIGDTIISGGEKISPFEVEEAAKKFAGVLDCVCVGKRDALSGRVPKLYVLWQGKPRENELKKHLLSLLEVFKVPRYYQTVEEIAKNDNGKTDRKYYKELEA